MKRTIQSLPSGVSVDQLMQPPTVTTPGTAIPGTLIYPPAPPPPPQPNEFQQFVAGSLGHDLPMFGYDLFSDVLTTFAPIDRVPVTPDYVIGPGDELLIRAWGQIDLDAHVVVDRTGSIYLPKVGNLTLAGLRFEQLQPYLKSSVGKVFRNFDLTVTLGQLRSIQVFVVGQARRPGTYTVSSLSTLVNALFASGGPSTKGSMRHIELKRDSKVVTDFDVYDLLLKGDKSKDVALLPGDIIFIPPVGSQVAIAGSVNVPAIYELRDKTDLGDILSMAGGLTNVADGQKVRVERIENHTTRRLDEFALNDGGRSRPLQDGDLVYVVPLSPKFENAVTLRGNVAVPGRYPWHAGMRIRDLIPSREVLLTRDYWLKQNLTAGPIDGTYDNWSPNDSATNSSAGNGNLANGALTNGTLTNGILTNGSATNGTANLYRRSDNWGPDAGAKFNRPDSLQPGPDAVHITGTELRTDVHRNAPEINWDYAVIQRLNTQDLTTHLIPFSLGKAILDANDADNLELQPGDVITIFSQADLRVPLQEQSKFVYLEGEVKSAGVYKVRPGETLPQLIQRAGGLTTQAYLFGAEFTRESTRREQQKSLDKMIRDAQRDLDLNAAASTVGTATPQDTAALKMRFDEQREELDKLKQLRPTGRIVLELTPSSDRSDDLPNLTLEDGDRFYVPYRTSQVNVAGEVYNGGSFLYDPDKRIGDYLKQAGGTTRYADRSHAFLLRADGSVVPRSSAKGFWGGGFDNLKLMPGDSIVVPQHIATTSTLKEIKDWTQIFSQFALGAAAIRVIKNP